jgi:hypothetical protein
VKTIRVPGDRKRIERILADIKTSDLKVGWFESAKYTNKQSTPVAMVAYWQEFKNTRNGAFIRKTIIENSETWRKIVGNKLSESFAGSVNANDVMNVLGLVVQGDIKNKLSEMGNYPENDPVVQRRRNRKNPPPNQSTAILRDTTTLLSTLTYVAGKR